MSILSYDWRSHHPATQILSLYCHMTGEVIIQLPRSCLYWHMTGEVIIQLPGYCLYADIWQEKSSSSYPIMSLFCNMTGEVIIHLPDHISILSYNWRSHHPATRSCLYTVIWQKSSSSYPDTVSILSYDWRSHHPATRSCLYTVIWLEKSSFSYPYTFSILSYDWRSHHPATQILSLYCHMTGEVIIQLPRYCLYAVIWQEKSSSSYPDTVSILSYDWRSHHPATRSCLYTVIWQSHHPATQIMSLCCHMTGEVIIQLSGSCLYTVIWQEKSSSSYPDTVSILSYERKSHPVPEKKIWANKKLVTGPNGIWWPQSEEWHHLFQSTMKKWF